MDIDNLNIFHDGEDNLRSLRKIELKEMLLNKNLKHSDLLRVRILITALSYWSVRKIAKKFGASQYLAKF